MAPDHERDDEDTREHPVAPRYPDAAPPAGEPASPEAAADGTPEGSDPAEAQDRTDTWAASQQEPPTDAQPTAQWPQQEQQDQQWQGRQQWQDQQAQPGQQGQQWPQAGQQWPGDAGRQQPAQSWQQPGQGPQQPAQWQQPQPQQQPQQWQQPAHQWQQPTPAGGPDWGPEYREAGYPTSPMVAIAAIVLIVYGLFVTLIGGAGVALSGLADQMVREAQRQGLEGLEGIDITAIADVFVVIFAFVLVIGILHLLSGIGIFLHKQWARVIGIVLATLGTLFGVLGLVGAANVPQGLQGSEWIFPVALTLGYGFTLFALIAGSSHFRKRWTR
jgi:hypothetical protein